MCALVLGDRLLRRARAAAGVSVAAGEVHLIDLLRAAFRSEDLPARRVRLADRLAAALEADGDASGALALLERAIGGLSAEEGARLRARRARLLRELGKMRELAAALAADADALKGPARRKALGERADLLDAAGEPERALAERLSALDEAPGDLAVLGLARRRLESTSRFEQSLKLATRAVREVTDRGEKLKLLRDVALLSEKATPDRRAVASAWLAVLEMDPDDLAAADAAERLLIAAADWSRYADLLAWAAARAWGGPEAAARRSALLWRLAELRRARLGQLDEALRLYRALVTPATPMPAVPGGARAAAGWTEPAAAPGEARPDRLLELHTARIAVAPSAAERAKAYLDRGLVLFEKLGRFADAEDDISRALDMDPRNVDVILAYERVCERTGRWTELEQSFKQKAATVAPAAAARLWFGIARVAERRDDVIAAREAYERAQTLDPALVEPVIALRRLATRRTDWSDVARLYEVELGLLRPDDGERARLTVELASIVGDRLGDSNRAIELLERVSAAHSSDARTLDLYFRHNLAATRPAGERRWDVAGQTLERLLAIGNEPADAADRYFRVGVAAEAAGQADQALVFYSRAYSRSPSYRPTLERLSQLCFEKGQWDNAWRATEGLLDRHRPNLTSTEVGELLVRSALCDVHIGQRLGAMARLTSLVDAGTGARDVADSWAAMRIEPRLLGGLEGDRRERVVRRVREALAITDSRLQVARRQAWEVLGALAVVEQRWDDAREALDRLAADPGAGAADRGAYLLAAGDIAGNIQNDPDAAARLYAQAQASNAGDPRLPGRLAATAPGATGAEDGVVDVDDVAIAPTPRPTLTDGRDDGST